MDEVDGTCNSTHIIDGLDAQIAELRAQLKDAEDVIGGVERLIRKAVNIAEDLDLTNKDALHATYSKIRLAQRYIKAYRAQYGEGE